MEGIPYLDPQGVTVSVSETNSEASLGHKTMLSLRVPRRRGTILQEVENYLLLEQLRDDVTMI